MNFDWKKLIGNVAPMLATALGGPFAGAAVTAISESLGLGPNATDAEIAEKLASADPETLLRLKQAEQAFTVRMAELGFANQQALEQIAATDRDSARKREIAVGDRTPQILVFVLLAAWSLANYFLFSEAIPEGNKELLSRALGSLDTLLGLAFAYFYGSTSGGKLKSELLAAK